MQIRRYIQEDYPKFLELINAVYNKETRNKAAQRFQWQYLDNPNNSDEDPLIFVLEEDSKFIGMVGTFPQRVRIGDAVCPAYWIGDYMVHPDSRLGFRAINLAKLFTKLPYLVMGFPAEYSIKIWLRLGGVQFSQLLRFSRPIKPLDEKNTRINVVKDLLDGWGSFFDKDKIKIVETKEFDGRFDRLWERSSKFYKALQVRDSRFLNWRFSKCPYISYQVLSALKGNEVLGYIALRVKKFDDYVEGSIVDLFTDRSNRAVSDVLVEAGIGYFQDSGCNTIKMTVSSEDKYLIDILDQHSFLDREVIDRGLFYNNTELNINAIILEPSNWFLTRADSDMDFSD